MADCDRLNKYEQKMSSRGQAEANAQEFTEMRESTLKALLKSLVSDWIFRT